MSLRVRVGPGGSGACRGLLPEHSEDEEQQEAGEEHGRSGRGLGHLVRFDQ